jgi:hypothetical protein
MKKLKVRKGDKVILKPWKEILLNPMLTLNERMTEQEYKDSGLEKIEGKVLEVYKIDADYNWFNSFYFKHNGGVEDRSLLYSCDVDLIKRGENK